MNMIFNAVAAARRFTSNTSGAVTVDWVAMTAAVVIVGMGIVYTVMGTSSSGVNGVVSGMNTEINDASSNIEGGASANVPTQLSGDE